MAHSLGKPMPQPRTPEQRAALLDQVKQRVKALPPAQKAKAQDRLKKHKAQQQSSGDKP